MGAAQQGQPNSVLRRSYGAATAKFVATLSNTDVTNEELELGAITPQPIARATRVTPDGLHATFMSASHALSELTASYDNTDQSSGETDDEVYVYDADADGAPAGLRGAPRGNPDQGARPAGPNAVEEDKLGAAARIPTCWKASCTARVRSPMTVRVCSSTATKRLCRATPTASRTCTSGRPRAAKWNATKGAPKSTCLPPPVVSA